MCAVVGHTVSMRTVSTASIPANESSSRITSGVWQVAFTIASKPVRATKTRSPAERSCASRMSRETASPSAISTSGAGADATRGVLATRGWTGRADGDTVCVRCTPATRAKMGPDFTRCGRSSLFAFRCWRGAVHESLMGISDGEKLDDRDRSRAEARTYQASLEKRAAESEQRGATRRSLRSP
jgi:hypothetical protein